MSLQGRLRAADATQHECRRSNHLLFKSAALIPIRRDGAISARSGRSIFPIERAWQVRPDDGFQALNASPCRHRCRFPAVTCIAAVPKADVALPSLRDTFAFREALACCAEIGHIEQRPECANVRRVVASNQGDLVFPLARLRAGLARKRDGEQRAIVVPSTAHGKFASCASCDVVVDLMLEICRWA